ncbi:glycogen-binding domain-containing protein, partial [bacterium]|nr:glycogen-binding domain-containing protein [bacterium]
MRKTIYIMILIILTGCIKNSSTISNFPTIMLQTGSEQNIDLTKYVSNYNNITIGKTDGVTAEHLADLKLLKLTADGSKSLIKLPLKVNKTDIMLLLKVNPMVAYTFSYKSEGSESNIVVMGQFNDWSRTALPLYDEDNDGIYERTVYLKPQRHEYKFVVDGVELIDPTNPIFISNNIGGWNSILELTEFKAESGGRIIKEKWEKGLLTYKYNPIDDSSTLEELILIHNNTFVDNNFFSIDENGLISVDYMKFGDGTLRITGIDEKNRVI